MPTEYFEARERALLGERYDRLYAPPGAEPARGVTVSALRMSPEAFRAGAGFGLEASPFCAAGFVVTEPGFKPGRHPWHHAGVFYSQEPSASAAAPLLGVRPGMRVLDLCAAPGGKTSQLASALAGQGLLVANEYVAARAEILKSNLERMGVSNAVVLNESPERIAAALPAFFDRILVDAPCSGEGMFRKEPAALAQHSEALVAQCAALGASILDSAAEALAPGGEILYSTCTFAPQEDEGQVAAFLARHPEFALADVMERAFAPFGSPGEANRTGGLPLDVSLVRRIWPCQGGEGHFMARLVKAGPPPDIDRAAQGSLWLARMQRPAAEKKKPVRPARGRRGGRGRRARPGAGGMARLCTGDVPRPGGPARRGAGGECASASCLPAPGAAYPAGRGAGGRGAQGKVCAGASPVHRLWGVLRQHRGPGQGGPPLRGLPVRPGDPGRHRPGGLVLRHGGRLPPGGRQGVGGQGEEPLPQSPAAAGLSQFSLEDTAQLC